MSKPLTARELVESSIPEGKITEEIKEGLIQVLNEYGKLRVAERDKQWREAIINGNLTPDTKINE